MTRSSMHSVNVVRRLPPRLILTSVSLALSVATSYAQTTDSQQPAQQPGSQAPTGDVQIKEIKKLSKISLVVLDKNCPDIVQPYKLVDNVASIGAFSLKESVKTGLEFLKNAVQSGPKEGRAKDELSDSTKLAAKQLNWLPMNAETLYGKKSHETETNLLDRKSKLGEKYYPVADEILNKILSTIKEKHEYAFQLYVLKNLTRNALARPGGYLYLDQGLLESPAVLPKAYFALAHEISHVLQRHETKELQGAVVDSITGKKQLMQVMQNVGNDPSVILAHVKVGKDIFSQHHSDQELQSDSCAVRLLSRVLPDRQELANTIDAFVQDLPPPEPSTPRSTPKNDAEKLAGFGHEIVDTPLKRHPNTQERSANLRGIYQEVLKTDGP